MKPKKRKKVLRELSRADKPTLGTHVHVTWPGMVEVIEEIRKGSGLSRNLKSCP